MLRMWNVSLVLATGILALLGTFLVRSGILNSIHAFGASTLGIPFLVLISVLVVGLGRARDLARAGACSPSTGSTRCSRARRSSCSTTWRWSGLCFVILWGTFFPLISEAFTGEQSSRRPAVVRQVHGAARAHCWCCCPGSARRSRGAARPPPTCGGSCWCRSAIGARDAGRAARGRGRAARPAALAMFCLGAFVLAVVGQEFARGVRARRAMSSEGVPRAAVSLVRRNRRRYGGYIVHVGVVVLLVGVAASSTFQDAHDVRLAPGERARVGGYDVTYVRPTERARRGVQRLAGEDRPGRRPARAARTARSRELHTERSYFPSNSGGLGAVSRYFEGEATSEVGLRAGLGQDLWTAVAPDTALLRRHDHARRPRVRGGHGAARRGARRAARRDAAPAGRALPGRCAAGALPDPGVAAGDLDLARGADRLRRRADRDLAAAGGRHAPCDARPRRRGSRASSARPEHACMELCWCWSCWRRRCS